MQHRLTQELTGFLSGLSEEERIEAINQFRMAIHSVSPFREEPVDCVLWIKMSISHPMTITPITLRLRRKTAAEILEADGFTQPIVVVHSTAEEYEIVDGFHRHELGKANRR